MEDNVKKDHRGRITRLQTFWGDVAIQVRLGDGYLKCSVFERSDLPAVWSVCSPANHKELCERHVL